MADAEAVRRQREKQRQKWMQQREDERERKRNPQPVPPPQFVPEPALPQAPTSAPMPACLSATPGESKNGHDLVSSEVARRLMETSTVGIAPQEAAVANHESEHMVSEITDRIADRIREEIVKVREEEAARQQAAHFSSQVRACETRLEIMETELRQAQEAANSAASRSHKLERAVGELGREKVSTEKAIQNLQEELALINQHLSEQQQKHAKARDASEVAADRVRVLESTLVSVRGELDKAVLLSQAANASLAGR